jgi:hypothetical protein
MKKAPPRNFYVNPKQQAFIQAPQKRKGFVGGRAAGKTTTYAIHNRLCFNYLPRAKRFTAGLTFNQILNKTLPSAIDAWTQMGLREYNKAEPKLGGHYVVCQKPPADWIKPFQSPRNYENCISFINGYTIEMLSMDRPDSNRGGNYDGGDVDESALMKKEVISKVLMPSIRGNKYRFNHYLHQSFTHYTSAAWLPEGQWIYEYEEMSKANPERYFYQEATAYDNIEVVGAEYIEDMKAEMSTLEFDVEVLNKRLKKLPNTFYPSFDTNRHCRWNTHYYAYDDQSGIWQVSNNDCDANRELELSFDFNSAFTSMIVCQEHGREFRCLNALYVKDGDFNKVIALTDLFCETYKDHRKKDTVFIYGDRNGNNRNPGADKTFYQQIIDRLVAKGWKPKLMVQGLDPDHKLKHLVINELLAETNPRLPVIRINQNTCKYLIISIQNSPILPDWKKDKRSERLLIDQAQATHLSDCFDNIVFRKYAKCFGYLAAKSQRVRII